MLNVAVTAEDTFPSAAAGQQEEATTEQTDPTVSLPLHQQATVWDPSPHTHQMVF